MPGYCGNVLSDALAECECACFHQLARQQTRGDEWALVSARGSTISFGACTSHYTLADWQVAWLYNNAQYRCAHIPSTENFRTLPLCVASLLCCAEADFPCCGVMGAQLMRIAWLALLWWHSRCFWFGPLPAQRVRSLIFACFALADCAVRVIFSRWVFALGHI